MERRDAPADRLGPDEVDARSELWADLPVDIFPAARETLITVARARHAPAALVEALEGLPPGQRYDHVYDVWQALGGGTNPPALEER